MDRKGLRKHVDARDRFELLIKPTHGLRMDGLHLKERLLQLLNEAGIGGVALTPIRDMLVQYLEEGANIPGDRIPDESNNLPLALRVTVEALPQFAARVDCREGGSRIRALLADNGLRPVETGQNVAEVHIDRKMQAFECADQRLLNRL